MPVMWGSAVLSQIQDGKERVIAYGSRALNKAEKNYCVTDKELLAIRYFVEYYRQYLLGNQFLIRTDHQALVWLFRLKEPKSRVARWLEVLSAYSFEVEYRPGPKHQNADSLSRCITPWDCQCAEVEPLKCGPCKKCVRRGELMQHSLSSATTTSHTQDDVQETSEKQPTDPEPATNLRAVKTRGQSQQDEINTAEIGTTWFGNQSKQAIEKLQKSDEDTGSIYKWVQEGKRPSSQAIVACGPAVRHYWLLWDSLEIRDNLLYRKFTKQDGSATYLQLMVPQALKKDVMYHLHDSILSGHLGRKKTLGKARQKFYWYEMKQDINLWIKKCDNCSRNKPPTKMPRAPMGTMPTGATLDRLSTDILGPLPETPRANKYILLVTDYFSKWVEIFPIPDQTASTCARLILNEVISRYGCPLSIHSDQGRNYESELFAELCQLLEIRKTRSSVRNPRCNGLAERFNRTLLRMIKAYLRGEEREWDLHLGCLAAAYRATPQESTGLTPNMIMLGREVRLPAELAFTREFSKREQTPGSYGEYVEILRDRMRTAHHIARKHLGAATQRQKAGYDTKISLHAYKVGDLVWYLSESCKPGHCPKLQPAYTGPLIVVEKLSDLDYRVQTNSWGTNKVVHHNKLKRYEGDTPPKWVKQVGQKLCSKPRK